MASLVGQQLKDTYDSLLKTSDNDALGGTYKEITDGAGNGSNLYLGTGGNVGIGGSPSRTLSVYSTSSIPCQIESSGADARISILTSSGSGGQGFVQASSGSLLLGSSNTERMKIHSTGDISFRDTSTNEAFYWDASTARLGLGTDSPSAKLQVEGGRSYFFSGDAFSVALAQTFAQGNYTYLGTNASGDFNVYDTSGNPRLTVEQSGNVGIGTDSPDAFTKLTVAGAMTLTGQNTGHGASRIKIGQDTTAISQIRFYGADASNAGILQFIGSSSDGAVGGERMRIDSSGNVGIGTDSPVGSYTKTLHIHGSGTGASLHLTDLASGATASDGLEVFQYSTDCYIWEREAGNIRFGTSATERMRIDSSGNVLVGKTASSGVATGNIEVSNSSSASVQIEGGTHEWSMLVSATTDALRFYQDSTERLRIDSSGNVLVGKTASGLATTGFQAIKSGQSAFVSDGDRSLILNRKTSDGSILEFRKDESEVGSIGVTSGSFAIGQTDTGIGFFNGDRIAFPATSAGAVQDNAIDLGYSSGRWKDLYLGGDVKAGGNVLVGTTDTAPGVADTNVGVALNSGRVFASAEADYALNLNRNTSDGDIVRFRKDGTTVGSIGTFSSDLYIGTNDSGLRFEYAGTNAIVPFDVNSVAVSDNATDLGSGSARFKDLYLSGSVYLGGTTSANALDDYEEGAWTPVLRGSGTAGTYEFATSGAYYTKVGRMVTVTANLVLSASVTGGGTGYAKITGLPYAKGANMAPQGTVLFRNVDFADDANYVNVEFVTSSASSELYFPAIRDNTGTSDTPISAFGNSNTINLSITYFT